MIKDTPTSTISPELLQQIFRHLDFPDLERVSRVSIFFKDNARSNDVWCSIADEIGLLLTRQGEEISPSAHIQVRKFVQGLLGFIYYMNFVGHSIPKEIKALMQSSNKISRADIRKLYEWVKARDTLYVWEVLCRYIGVEFPQIDHEGISSIIERAKGFNEWFKHHKLQLTKLERLDLDDRDLETLPPELFQLTELKWLNLQCNYLETLPPELGQLTKLELLDLECNRLKTLPPELGQLTNLELLDLSNNRLETFPPELGQLTKLGRLDLQNNCLETFPPELGQLTSLEELYLSSNSLKTLLPELGQLTKLGRLDLQNNRLETLPPELGQLTKLESLDLESNHLQTLPPELCQLTKLKSLNLKGNNLPSDSEVQDFCLTGSELQATLEDFRAYKRRKLW